MARITKRPADLLPPEVLLGAYAQGYFPMAEERTDTDVFWLNPEDRGVIPLDTFHLPRRLARKLRSWNAGRSTGHRKRRVPRSRNAASGCRASAVRKRVHGGKLPSSPVRSFPRWNAAKPSVRRMRLGRTRSRAQQPHRLRLFRRDEVDRVLVPVALQQTHDFLELNAGEKVAVTRDATRRFRRHTESVRTGGCTARFIGSRETIAQG